MSLSALPDPDAPKMSKPSTQTLDVHKFAILGMTCQACATRLERVIAKKANVQSVSVNYATHTLMATGQMSTDEVLTWIKQAGFDGRSLADNHTNHTPCDKSPIPYHLMALLVLASPFVLTMLPMLAGHHVMLPVWVQAVIATVVQFYFGLPFYRRAWPSVKGRLANMDVLVALATTVVWLYSVWAWWQNQGHVYFESSVMVIAFVSLGKYLESRTKQEGLEMAELFHALLPTTVKVKQGDDYVQTPIDELTAGDVILATQGDKIAADGVVLSSSGQLEQSHLTGESVPIFCQAGDDVLAGSVVVDGCFEYRATHAGADTVLADVQRALQEAQGTKADIARLADRVSAVFVPVVVAVALVVGFVGLSVGLDTEVALLQAVSVLVIACPCALGLATPTAIMAGMSVAAKWGVYFKDASSLEKAGSIDVIAFDKTGTLTHAKFELLKVHLLPHYDADTFGRQDEILSIMASAEQGINHPVANAIRKYTKTHQLPIHAVRDVQTVMGQGVQACVMRADWQGVVKVGQTSWVGVADKDVPSSQNVLAAISINDVPVAICEFGDVIKADARQVIQQFAKSGVQTWILSGDRKVVVHRIAEQLGVDKAYGELSAVAKADVIARCQQQGRRVAMMGDGVNDSVALATADVSFAVGGAFEIAKQASSVQLLSDDLWQAYRAYHVAKRTLCTIKQNLFFAFFYNILGILAAAFGLLTPTVAAMAMTLSSLCVVANAVRLKHLPLPTWEQKSA